MLYIYIVLYKQQHTCAIEHGQQYGGNPGRVAVSHPKLQNQLFEKDADRFWESVGEARDDKTAGQDRPAPPPVRSLHPSCTHVHRHASHGVLGLCPNGGR